MKIYLAMPTSVPEKTAKEILEKLSTQHHIVNLDNTGQLVMARWMIPSVEALYVIRYGRYGTEFKDILNKAFEDNIAIMFEAI